MNHLQLGKTSPSNLKSRAHHYNPKMQRRIVVDFSRYLIHLKFILLPSHSSNYVIRNTRNQVLKSLKFTFKTNKPSKIDQNKVHTYTTQITILQNTNYFSGILRCKKNATKEKIAEHC